MTNSRVCVCAGAYCTWTIMYANDTSNDNNKFVGVLFDCSRSRGARTHKKKNDYERRPRRRLRTIILFRRRSRVSFLRVFFIIFFLLLWLWRFKCTFRHRLPEPYPPVGPRLAENNDRDDVDDDDERWRTTARDDSEKTRSPSQGRPNVSYLRRRRRRHRSCRRV